MNMQKIIGCSLAGLGLLGMGASVFILASRINNPYLSQTTGIERRLMEIGLELKSKPLVKNNEVYIQTIKKEKEILEKCYDDLNAIPGVKRSREKYEKCIPLIPYGVLASSLSLIYGAFLASSKKKDRK
jgi:hypothetical protein